jgi:hypothetical protein
MCTLTVHYHGKHQPDEAFSNHFKLQIAEVSSEKLRRLTIILLINEAAIEKCKTVNGFILFFQLQ